MPNDIPFLGIDFGTSQSSMAWFNPKSGQAEVIRNAEGEDKTPSVVYYGNGETLVGKPAEELLENERERRRILASVKRHLAKPVQFAVGDRQFGPVDVVADILRKLKRDAEEGYFHEPVEHAVITNPVVFDQLENELLEKAAYAAGFTKVVLLPEPVAAAIAYAAAGRNVGDSVLVYDLGGGTFDLALLNRFDDEEFALAAEPRGLLCGGDDFDRDLYDRCDAIARETLGRSIGANNRRDLFFLRECRKRKENLSSRTKSEFSSYLSGGVQFKHTIEREAFESLIAPRVRSTIDLTRALFREAEAEGRPPQTVVLIGGSSQVPLVQHLLREDLPVEPLHWHGRDLAVALGAACYARKLWMRRWQAAPISTTCPACQKSTSSHLFGRVQCAECRWPFEIDEQGAVVAGVPIATRCPHCNEPALLHKAGATTCSACKWQFEIDGDGCVVAGQPIRTQCPNCHKQAVSRQAGPLECQHCEWPFEIDANGKVTGGQPIGTECPNCRRKTVARQAGAMHCPQCKWPFEIDQLGKVTAGQPIKVSCPTCNEKLALRQAGPTTCSKCQWQFEVDAGGTVVAGKPISTRCPSCGKKMTLRHAGATQCVDCQWLYEIDQNGAVTSGIPIKVPCPDCQTELQLRTSGEVRCGHCERVFEISANGEVLEQLRAQVLRSPLNKNLMQHYLQHRSAALRVADRELDPRKLVFAGVAEQWNASVGVGATGGYITGTVAGLIAGFLMYFSSSSGRLWPVCLWAVATMVGSLVFLANYDDCDASTIRENFNDSVGKLFGNVSGAFVGGSAIAVLALVLFTIPAIIVMLVAIVVLSSFIGAILALTLWVLFGGLIGAVVGGALGSLISLLYGTSRGLIGGLESAAQLTGD